MAAAARAPISAASFAPPAPKRRYWSGTPEIYFNKQIDNSRLVKVDDPKRHREMRLFTVTMGLLFAMVMLYAWQHFSAIEYGYKIEALKSKRDVLVESNRQLRLDEAQLRNPERIDAMAKQMGLQSPSAGQVLQLDERTIDSGAPIMARADVAVISSALR